MARSKSVACARPLSACLPLVALFGAFIAIGVSHAGAPVNATQRVSVDSAGNEADNFSRRPAISGDGRFVAFESRASNLVPGDTNDRDDIFLHDRQTGETTRVSVDSNGMEGNGSSNNPAITPDGRFVAFASGSTNLVPGPDTNGFDDVFVHDRQTGGTSRVSVDSNGVQAADVSGTPAITADGRFVTFFSRADNLVAGDTNNGTDYFRHDRQTGDTIRINLDSFGNQTGGEGFLNAAPISANGRFVAFQADAGDVVPDDNNDARDIFVRDLQTGDTTRVSVDSQGNEGNDDSGRPALSPDGRFVTFDSMASNLVPGDTNEARDVFVHDRDTGETTRVSVDNGGTQANDFSSDPSISDNGRFVAFASAATNLVSGDANEVDDVFLHDRTTGQTAIISVDPSGDPGNEESDSPALSSGGRFVAFASDATNLVTADTNEDGDIFVRDLGAAIQGDADCDGDADAVDSLFVLREVAGLSTSACIPQGDVNCDGERTAVDSLAILRYVAALPALPQNEPCIDIGDALS